LGAVQADVVRAQGEGFGEAASMKQLCDQEEEDADPVEVRLPGAVRVVAAAELAWMAKSWVGQDGSAREGRSCLPGRTNRDGLVGV
jgi:hypothetical protein